jgi:acyl carrier protein phosphodiesterase
MNYLAHLFLSQPTAQSHCGNLLGDFRKGVNLDALPEGVIKGLSNHYLVDKFTDAHEHVKQAKLLFTPHQRRFAPVALDMMFDHLLITHWSRYSDTPFSQFCQQSYNLLNHGKPFMPPAMCKTVTHMIANDWFKSYATFEGIAYAITRVAQRIRFTNQFAQSVTTLEANYTAFEDYFNHFFPQLVEHVAHHKIEKNTAG